MEEKSWPYPNIEQTDYLSQIVHVENILQKYGAEYIEDPIEKNTWIFKDGNAVSEMTRKRV